MRRVVITGVGVISPIGNTADEFWTSLKEGRGGVQRISKFDPSDLKTQIAAEVKDFQPEPVLDRREIRRIDLFSQYAMVAADEAIRSCGIDFGKEDPFNTGVILGSGIGGINVLETQVETYMTKGPSRISPFYITGMITDIIAGHVSERWEFRGPNYVTTSACASATHAIGNAYYAIQRGDADIMITGGSEGSITPTSIAGFINNQALSRRNNEPEKASRPFNQDRDGFVMGEGAGVLVVEEYERAKKRGADILAEITGVAFTADAHHITAPHPDGLSAARAMERAIEHSCRNREDVGYINCHCPSTPAGDAAETRAIKKVFGDGAYDLNISSTKSMTGHLLGAAGAVEAIATAYAIKHSVVPPTINYEVPDPECDLNCTPNEAVERDLSFALSNSFGFGGHNATLAMARI